VGALRNALEGLPGSLPIVVVGEHQRVVSAEIVYQAGFVVGDEYDLGNEDEPVAVALQLMPI
jgi:hypothetical protein